MKMVGLIIKMVMVSPRDEKLDSCSVKIIERNLYSLIQ
jgi:hypothetical protein